MSSHVGEIQSLSLSGAADPCLGIVDCCGQGKVQPLDATGSSHGPAITLKSESIL